MKTTRLTREQHQELLRQRKAPRPPSPESQQRLVDDWNLAHANIGQKVRVLKDDGSTVDTVVTSKAWVLGGHTAVIMLHKFSGAYSLARVTAL